MPLTGTLRLMASLRSVRSLVPVQMSTDGFLISAAIFWRVAARQRGRERGRAGGAAGRGLGEQRRDVTQQRGHVYLGPDVGGRSPGDAVGTDDRGRGQPVKGLDPELGQAAGAAAGPGQARGQLLILGRGKLVGGALERHVSGGARGDDPELAVMAERVDADGQVGLGQPARSAALEGPGETERDRTLDRARSRRRQREVEAKHAALDGMGPGEGRVEQALRRRPSRPDRSPNWSSSSSHRRRSPARARRRRAARPGGARLPYACNILLMLRGSTGANVASRGCSGARLYCWRCWSCLPVPRPLRYWSWTITDTP